MYHKGLLNGNVLVVKNDSIVYEKSFGFVDGTKTQLLNKNHKFNIGSIYKEFPAVAVMMLQEQGKLNINDNISNYVHELPQWSSQVTIKNLLQYSSGLPLVPWDVYFDSGVSITDEYIFEELKKVSDLEFKPGYDYLYSNFNPILLIKVVESITGLPFKDYIQNTIMIPFNMKNILIKEQYPYSDRTLMAIPFDKDFKEDSYRISVKSLLFNATARDMATWFQKLEDFEITSKSSVKVLSREVKAGNNIQAPLGRCDWKDDEIVEHFHHGSTANYECVVRSFKQEGIIVAVLTNQKNSNAIEISDRLDEEFKLKKAK